MVHSADRGRPVNLVRTTTLGRRCCYKVNEQTCVCAVNAVRETGHVCGSSARVGLRVILVWTLFGDGGQGHLKPTSSRCTGTATCAPRGPTRVVACYPSQPVICRAAESCAAS